jgi:ribosomal protein S6
LAQNIFDQTEIKKRQESIATENAKIEIINQSGDNQLAYKIQRLLTDKLGMNNVSVINNSQSPIAQQTTVTDNSNGAKLFTLDELIKKLPATLSNQAADASSSSYDIIIRLGSDLVDIYKYEEDSIEDYNKAQDAQANLDMLNYNQ